MSNIQNIPTPTEFEHNYYHSVKHYDSQYYQDYIRHELDIYNSIEFKGNFYIAVYQTGCSYRWNDYSCPSSKIALSSGGGTDKLLMTINEMVESGFDNEESVNYYIEEINDSNVKSKDDLLELYTIVKENLIQAEHHFECFFGEEFEPEIFEDLNYDDISVHFDLTEMV